MHTTSQQEIKIFQVTDPTLPEGRARLLQIDLYSISQINLLQIALGQVRKEAPAVTGEQGTVAEAAGGPLPRAEQRSGEGMRGSALPQTGAPTQIKM